MSGRSFDDFRAAHDPEYELQSDAPVYARELGEAKRFVITSAQNATPVNRDFWNVLLTICEVAGAEPLVIPFRYKNPTSQWSGSQQNAEHWAAEVRPFLWNQRKALNKNLTLLADIKVQPTASSPLNGAEAITAASSGIIGHPKVHTRSIPTPQSRMAKLMMTTGACTVPNYTDSRAGRVGEFHHSTSALMVELAPGGKFFIRRLHFDSKTKSVTDAGTRYTTKGAEVAPRAIALVMGDTHVDFIDPSVEKATFGLCGIVPVTRPENLVWHDLLDGYSCNPHHAGSPFNKIAKRSTGADSVEAEVRRAISFVGEHTPAGTKSWVVQSNHDDFLRRWINNTDWRTDPVNARFYLETALAMCSGTHMDSSGTVAPDPFRYWFEMFAPESARCVSGSLVLGGVECGFHGDKGPNGARGSINNMRRLGVKTIIGHSHSPGEDEGATQVGTSTRLRLEYNSGPSSWLNAHCLLNADGKRQLIVIVDGEWRLNE